MHDPTVPVMKHRTNWNNFATRGGTEDGVWPLMEAESILDLDDISHACREKESNSHKGQQALQPLLPSLLKVFVCGTVLAQREAAYALANLLVGKGESMQLHVIYFCMLQASCQLLPKCHMLPWRLVSYIHVLTKRHRSTC